MIAAIHAMVHVHISLHITVLAMRGTLGRMHIAKRRLRRLRCDQYKKGQKYIFHNDIYHTHFGTEMYETFNLEKFSLNVSCLQCDYCGRYS